MSGPTQEEIWEALVESVKLQSHYAKLLNIHDGGERVTFADAHAWIKRVRDSRAAQVFAKSREKEQGSMAPDEWLCAAFSIGAAEKAFKLISIGNAGNGGSMGVTVRMLHKESGAVWKFQCLVEKAGVK